MAPVTRSQTRKKLDPFLRRVQLYIKVRRMEWYCMTKIAREMMMKRVWKGKNLVAIEPIEDYPEDYLKCFFGVKD